MSGARDDGPKARGETARQALRRALSPEPRTARELSGMTSLSEKDVVSHLEHLERSLEAEGSSLSVLPARCFRCGFEFRSRERFHRPGRCPECKSERVQPPRFFLG